MKLINNPCKISLIAFVFGVLLSVQPASADSHLRPESGELCKKYGIEFPVKELGGCKNYTDCRRYCQDPHNNPFCHEYGRLKNISEEDIKDKSWTGPDESDFQKAYKNFDQMIGELGCGTYKSCKTFCSLKENFDTCAAATKKYHIVGGYIDNPGNKQVIDKAKQVLGCNSQSECASFCDNVQNQQKCTQLAYDVGLAGGQQAVGPGGCKSPETCKAFCEDPKNAKECASFGYKDIRKEPPFPIRGDAKQSPDQTPGPGGCKSEEECISYCTKNYTDPGCQADASKYYSGNQQPGPGGCKSEAECTDYCTKNYNDSECQKYTEQYGFKGPGGCSTNEACSAYCTQNYQDAECAKYSSTFGFSGPGGCSDTASCTSYCTSNYQDPECAQYSEQYYSGFKGPGGCSDQASCTSYCQANYDSPECAQYSGQYKEQYEQQKKQYEQQYEEQSRQYEQQRQAIEQERRGQYQQQAPSSGVQGVTTTSSLFQLILDALFR